MFARKHTTHQNGDWARRPSITGLSFETQHRTKENDKSRKIHENSAGNLNKNNKIYWRVEWKELIHINIINSSYILYIVYAIADTIYAQLNEARKQFLSYVVTIFHLYHACILFYILYLIWLVVSTPRKSISQLGSLFPIYGKIKMFRIYYISILHAICHMSFFHYKLVIPRTHLTSQWWIKIPMGHSSCWLVEKGLKWRCPVWPF